MNSVCVWQYNRYPGYATNCVTTEEEEEGVTDEGLPTALGDSADEPRMVCSAAHLGDVQQLSSSAHLSRPNNPSHYPSWTNWKEPLSPSDATFDSDVLMPLFAALGELSSLDRLSRLQVRTSG